jgi:LmbE family N-acetylglucosaminyl deacetylase
MKNDGFMTNNLRPLLGRTLVLAAHPDDEAVGCGALLQRMSDPVVIFATDGAPRSDYFWGRYGSREEYARLRAAEAQHALEAIGVAHFHFLCEDEPVADQELYTQLDRAYASLAETVESEMPDAILTLAYEGGHPDHDACCFLANLAARQFGLPVWEMPLYHRVGGQIERQEFVLPAREFAIEGSVQELEHKQRMIDAYASQAETLREFSPPLERFRPMLAYDFSRPPIAAELNYEAWQWPMSGDDLCRAFGQLQSHSVVNTSPWGIAA